MSIPKPVILVVLDGWGEAPPGPHNAIALANTPVWDKLMREFPHVQLNASEGHVGLPSGQMGNSEVGHMHLGSGRRVMQDLPRIDEAIADGSLARNPVLLEYIEALKTSGGTCHVMGLLSPGGVHSHQAHMAALAKIICAAGVPVAIHAFLDGRDTPPKSALEYLAAFDLPLATLSGRYFAMDRDKRWDRVQQAYETLARAAGTRFATAAAAIRASYAENITDEFLKPCVIDGYAGMKDGDGILMANFRADRAREITAALLEPGFSGFSRGNAIRFAAALGMTEVSATHNAWMRTLFPPQELSHLFGEVVASAGRTQLRIAETEKYAHVTFFFNGGREEPFPGETRILVPSPGVATYDLKPEMSAPEVTEKLCAAIEAEQFDVVVVNYANTDMVGHTGDVEAAKKAVEAVDACLGKLSAAVLKKGGAMLITADHGNAECLFDHDTAQAHTAHTLNLVPALLVHEALRGKRAKPHVGTLADCAPTLLEWLNLPQPQAMTGHSLLAQVV